MCHLPRLPQHILYPLTKMNPNISFVAPWTFPLNNLSTKMLYCAFFASCRLLPMAPASPLPIEDFDSCPLLYQLQISCYFLHWLKYFYFLSIMFLAGAGINYRSFVGKTSGNSVPKSGKSLKQSNWCPSIFLTTL